MEITALKPGCYGPLVQKVQYHLMGKVPLKPDGIFGPKTRDAIRHVTGTPGDVIDQEVLNALNLEMTVFAWCLNLTGHFENTMYSRCVGNFDGAGITAGIIGFNLKSGTLQRALNRFADSLRAAGAKVNWDWVTPLWPLTEVKPEDVRAWPRKQTPFDLETIGDALQRLAELSEWRMVQEYEAYNYYYVPAVNTLKQLGINNPTPLELANVFDCMVQTNQPRSIQRINSLRSILHSGATLHDAMNRVSMTNSTEFGWAVSKRRAWFLSKDLSEKVIWGFA